MPNPRNIKFLVFAALVVALLSLPFVLIGEWNAPPIVATEQHRAWALGLIAIVLLTADSLAPVPSSLVIVGVAIEAGWVAGTIAGTVGLCGQVLAAAWFGRVAVGRLASRFFDEADVKALRASLQQRVGFTLGCLRSVPLLAESSVVIAASLGIPLRRICWVTLLPNFAVAAAYSLAAASGIWAAGAAVVGSIAVSVIVWRVTARG